jgi:hypothetical protein
MQPMTDDGVGCQPNTVGCQQSIGNDVTMLCDKLNFVLNVLGTTLDRLSVGDAICSAGYAEELAKEILNLIGE